MPLPFPRFFASLNKFLEHITYYIYIHDHFNNIFYLHKFDMVSVLYIYIYDHLIFMLSVVASVESCLESCYLGTRSKVMQRAWVIVRICGTQLGQASVRTDCINCINCMCCNILYILYIHMYCFCILLYSFFSVFIVATDFWGNSCEHLYMPCQGLDRRSSRFGDMPSLGKAETKTTFQSFFPSDFNAVVV